MERSERVAAILREKGYEVIVKKVQKGDETKIGLIIGSGKIRPTLYLDPESEADEKAAEEIIRLYEKAKVEDNAFDYEKFMDWENIKDNLFICLRQPTSEKCHDIKKPFLDLEMYVRARVEFGIEDASSTVIIKPELLEIWDASEEEVFDIAIKNTKEAAKSKTLIEILLEKAPEEDRPFLEVVMDGMIPEMSQVLTTGTFGAGAMICAEKLKEAAELFNSDVYIVPSSVHEVLLFSDKGVTQEEYKLMIEQVNANEVAPEEVLSNHVYVYNKDTGLISY